MPPRNATASRMYAYSCVTRTCRDATAPFARVNIERIVRVPSIFTRVTSGKKRRRHVFYDPSNDSRNNWTPICHSLDYPLASEALGAASDVRKSSRRTRDSPCDTLLALARPLIDFPITRIRKAPPCTRSPFRPFVVQSAFPLTNKRTLDSHPLATLPPLRPCVIRSLLFFHSHIFVRFEGYLVAIYSRSRQS